MKSLLGLGFPFCIYIIPQSSTSLNNSFFVTSIFNTPKLTFSHPTKQQYNTSLPSSITLPSSMATTSLTSDDEELDHQESEEEEHSNAAFCQSLYGVASVLDPTSKWVREWNWVFLLVCAAGLFVDPLFLYTLSISESWMCVFIDGWLAITVTVLRCMGDALHLWNMWLQLKTATKSSFAGSGEGDGRGENRRLCDSSPRAVALRYLKSKKGFFFDLFVILPFPQVVLWIVIPRIMKEGLVTSVMTVLLIVFLFQYLPKLYHSVCLLRRLQNLSGYIFGTVWWGIALNLIAYFVAAHAAGACWYLLGVQRAAKCLKEQCRSATTNSCGLRLLSCKDPIFYGPNNMRMGRDGGRFDWANNRLSKFMCLDTADNFDYGAYKWTVQLVVNQSRLEKILFPIFWGLMTLSTFGNLESTTEWLEVVFNIIVLTSGLLLVTMLIGNIKKSAGS
ncbi:hypothetical protein Csa_011681 [Cucumis sativus]|nr:hypothetical protein Csa_011681 [Cucumis sativus]